MDRFSLLKSVSVFEKDVNLDDMCVWSYPALSPSLQSLVLKRLQTEGKGMEFLFWKLKNDWIYSFTVFTKEVVNVSSVTVVITATSFHPEKFLHLLRIFSYEYIHSTGNASTLVEVYMKILLLGTYTCSNNQIPQFLTEAYPLKSAMTHVSKVLELLQLFGPNDFTILWNAIVLKKRVLFVSDSVDSLLSITRTMPQLAIHRQNFSYVRPLVTSESEFLEDLEGLSYFVAGTLDMSLAYKVELYDVLVSIPDRRVVITQAAQSDLKFSSLHKEFIVMCKEMTSDATTTDMDLLQAIAKKTSTIVSQLKSLLPADGGKLSDELIARRLGPEKEALATWLSKVAWAEGLM